MESSSTALRAAAMDSSYRRALYRIRPSAVLAADRDWVEFAGSDCFRDCLLVAAHIRKHTRVPGVSQRVARIEFEGAFELHLGCRPVELIASFHLGQSVVSFGDLCYLTPMPEVRQLWPRDKHRSRDASPTSRVRNTE